MNLQVNSPYKKCPYKCPYCVAGFTDINDFPFTDDLYIKHKYIYLEIMVEMVKQHEIDSVVITGSTEPTLFPDWIQDVVTNIRPFVKTIEIQTHNYNWRETFGGKIGVIAYSHDKLPTFNRPRIDGSIVRDVFIWSKNLSAKSVVDYFTSHPTIDQCTVKQMVDNSYSTKEINDYINSVRIPITQEDVALLTSAGIRVDNNCNESEGRYLIYRTNGNLYQRWSDTVPLSI